jgi:hypothetical protein
MIAPERKRDTGYDVCWHPGIHRIQRRDVSCDSFVVTIASCLVSGESCARRYPLFLRLIRCHVVFSTHGVKLMIPQPCELLPAFAYIIVGDSG